jgi:para-aminobenzoate synthetase component 1
MLERLERLAPLPRARVQEITGWLEPTDALLAASNRLHPVLLLSGLTGHPSARFSILSWDPAFVVSVRDGRVSVSEPARGGTNGLDGAMIDPFNLLRIAPAGRVRRTPGLPFVGGAIGFLGYGFRRYVERLPGRPPDPLNQPDAWFGVYDGAVIFDHAEGRIALVAAGSSEGSARQREIRAAARLEEMRELMDRVGAQRATRSGSRRSLAVAGAHAVTPRAEHKRRIVRALDYIGAGDIYQVNLSHRIECPVRLDPIELFRDLSLRNPAPFAAFLDTGRFKVISASPERFLALHGRRASSSPIKGTRPRGRGADEDGRLVQELLGSAKDRAENVMIADLVRNDLGRVCEAGSVHVEKLCGLESFATVHHLVSTIAGRLRPDRDRVDLLRALFPGGSMTGAPKVRAMEVIDELEQEERGIYSGSIGYLSLDGGMDFNIVIRTILCLEGKAHYRVGGGIVADSDPEAEYRETLDKGRALLEALRVKKL